MEYYLAHTTKKSSQTTYKHGEGTSLLQCLRLPTSAAGGKSSVPGQGTKILCAMRCTPPTTRNMEILEERPKSLVVTKRPTAVRTSSGSLNKSVYLQGSCKETFVTSLSL